MFGTQAHASINGLLNSMAHVNRPFVVSHGGVAVGTIPPNTAASVRAALHSGADIVKIDVSASADNIFYAFHDGTEPELLGIERNIQSMPAADIAELTYQWKNRPGRRAHVERLVTILAEFRGAPAVFALDRSWWRWPTLLRVLDGLRMPSQLMLKVPAWESSAINALRQHRTAYPTLAICSSMEELDALHLDDHDLNFVGVELIAHDENNAWFDPATIAGIHDRDLLVWVNSETLTTGIPLFGGYDDELCILESPTAAWTRLLELGVDAVQTELPWLLRDLREVRGR